MVLDTLVPAEADVQAAEGLWYTMCIQPYRTLDNVIEGAVLASVDITAAHKLEDALREREQRLRVALGTSDIEGGTP